MLGQSDENYLKSLWIYQETVPPVRSTQAMLARHHKHSGPAAHKIIHKLIGLDLVGTTSDGTLTLTTQGLRIGALLVRKHRLWEVFLVDKLGYGWGTVHELAESLEHIGDEELINRLEQFLNSPRYDPHGDPIPDREGKIDQIAYYALSDWPMFKPCHIMGVREQSKSFLDWMEATGLLLGSSLQIVQKLSFDGSIVVELLKRPKGETQKATLSAFAADHVIVGE